MTANANAPTLVVGAGVTGLTLASVLARQGTQVRIIDRLPGVLPFARAATIHSRTLEVFQDLDLIDALLESGQKILGTSQFANGERLLQTRYSQIGSPFPFSLNLEQWKTEGWLEKRLGDFGVTVERQTELVAHQERLDGLRVTLRRPDGSTEITDTPWLVGCDGAHSTVRHLNRQHFPGEADPSQYVTADVVLDGPLVDDEICMFVTDQGMMEWIPLPGRRSVVVADLAEHHDGRTEEPALADIQGLLDARGPAGVRARDPRWLSWYRTHYRLTPHYRHGRTLLAGDAAHIHSPVGGQGMNTGIQDAYNLGWKLALVSLGRAPQSLLDSYERERRNVAKDVLAMTKGLTEHLTSYAQLSEATRDHLYRHVHLPEADRLGLARHIEELDLDYRRSPICSELAGTRARLEGGPHAGAEAVDAGPLQVEGRSLSLFELIAGPRHTLLLLVGREGSRQTNAGSANLAAEVVRVYGDLVQVCIVLPANADDRAFTRGSATIVRDLEAALHDRYGAHGGGLYLIRPDGYIGWRSDRPSLIALRDHLANLFTSSAT